MGARRKAILLFCEGLVLILFLASGFVLYKKWTQSRKVETDLAVSAKELSALYNKKPFPSLENINQEKDNLQIMREERAELQQLVSEGQVDPVQKSPDAFNAQLWKVIRDSKSGLVAQAQEKNVQLPKEFPFSFKRYMGGDFPAHQDVSRLTQQLTIVQELCQVLYNARIVELKDVLRDEFEGGEVSAAPMGGGGRPRSALATAAAGATGNPINKNTGIIPEGKLYGTMHFTLAFKATETALRKVLNQLARHRMVIEITRLEMVGDEPILKAPSPAVVLPPGDQAAPPPSPEQKGPGPRDQRILSGRGEMPLSVVLDVDVYRFGAVEGEKRP